MDERVRAEVQKVFAQQAGIERVYFPERSNQVPDRPAIALVVLAPDQGVGDPETPRFVEQVTRECGNSGRTYKSALIWAIPDAASSLYDETRQLLAWQDIEEEESDRLDDTQRHQLAQSLKKSARDLREAVWRTYKNIGLLGRDNAIRVIDLGLVHSSAADSMAGLILGRLEAAEKFLIDFSEKFSVEPASSRLD